MSQHLINSTRFLPRNFITDPLEHLALGRCAQRNPLVLILHCGSVPAAAREINWPQPRNGRDAAPRASSAATRASGPRNVTRDLLHGIISS